MDKFIKRNGDRVIFKPIREQLNFILMHAKENQNPIDHLEKNQKFTFGVITDREFSSPEELRLKESFDRIFDELKKITESVTLEAESSH